MERPRGGNPALLAAIVVAGITAAAVATPGLLNSDRIGSPAVAVATLVAGFSFIGTSLFVAHYRPGNPTSILMALTGVVWFVGAWNWSNTPGLFITGALIGNVWIVFLVHLLLGFPSGHIEGKWDRRFVALGWLSGFVMQVPPLLFAKTPSPDTCADCPVNPILVSDQLGLAQALVTIQILIAVPLLLCIAVVVARRSSRAAPAMQRVYRPVLIAGGLALAVIGAQIGIGGGQGSGKVSEVLYVVAQGLFALVPFAFLIGVMRARLSRETAVSGLIARLGDATLPRGELREALAGAIGDPSLELAYWVPDAATYVDAEGRPLEMPAEGSDRTWSPVEREGQALGAIVFDAELIEQRELIRAAGGAASIALENERLDAELRARLEDLRASRARIVRAGDEERRRLERDLHDGAQQRLVSLALTLRLARKRLDSDDEGAADLIDEAMAELEEATSELRKLARGIHPAVLSDRGLAAAVGALAGRAPLPVEVRVSDDERMPAPVESAAYFVVAEALTNVARYAGAQHAAVMVERVNGGVTVEVRDDGIGGADPSAGSGLRGLADRVAAVDGRLSVESPPGEGTTVRAEIPCES